MRRPFFYRNQNDSRCDRYLASQVATMRPCAAVLIFALCSCFIYADSRTDRENESNFNNTNKSILRDLIPCVQYLGPSKCVSAYGAWRAIKAFEEHVEVTSKSVQTFPWQRYNESDEELYTQLYERTNALLQHRPLNFSLNEDFSIQLGTTSDGKMKIDLLKNIDVATGRSTMKKLTKQFYAVMPFLLLPGLVLSAILPFLLPTFKMMTIATGMLNKIALIGAVFTLLRNNAFNDKYAKKVIYINNGYANDKYQQLSNSPSEVVIDTNFANKLNEYATDDVKDFPLVGSKPIDVDYQVNQNWLKDANDGYGKVRNVQILGGNFLNPWRKQDGLNDEVSDRNE